MYMRTSSSLKSKTNKRHMRKTKKQMKQSKKKTAKRSFFKGGSSIAMSMYPLNRYETDPQRMMESARNLPNATVTGGKNKTMKKKTLKKGGMSLAPFTNFVNDNHQSVLTTAGDIAQGPYAVNIMNGQLSRPLIPLSIPPADKLA